MKQIYLTIAPLLFILFTCTAQTVHTCATDDYQNNLLQQNAAYKNKFELLNKQENAFIESHPDFSLPTPVYIPVVFHVMYNTAAQNIPISRILAQMDVLNNDFQRLNADTINTPSVFAQCANGSQIHFCLAQRDPGGQPTTGIITVPTPASSFTGAQIFYQSQGGDPIWPAESYLNIYVGNLANGVLGFAQYPGGNDTTDGVVVHYECIGGLNTPGTLAPYNLGRIATHQVGHWLNLQHFGTNCSTLGTGICQPPQQSMPTGCPAFPEITCNNGPNGNEFMNFMQGVNDSCMNMFHYGQITRMNACLASSISLRNALASSPGCLPVGINEINNLINSCILYPNPSTGNIQLIFKAKEKKNLKCEILNMIGEKAFEQILTTSDIRNTYNLDVSFLSKGIYLLDINIDGERIVKKIVIE
ncbi:MAG TPA: zinc-dependent metalloprotease [Bacteroidia bacterium]|nr:zinc-dependent metalloprotease [Bacteroidia bacterium]